MGHQNLDIISLIHYSLSRENSLSVTGYRPLVGKKEGRIMPRLVTFLIICGTFLFLACEPSHSPQPQENLQQIVSCPPPNKFHRMWQEAASFEDVPTTTAWCTDPEGRMDGNFVRIGKNTTFITFVHGHQVSYTSCNSTSCSHN